MANTRTQEPLRRADSIGHLSDLHASNIQYNPERLSDEELKERYGLSDAELERAKARPDFFEDLAEYGVTRIFFEASQGLKQKGLPLNATTLQNMRDELQFNGRKIENFTAQGAKISSIYEVLRDLDLDTYGQTIDTAIQQAIDNGGTRDEGMFNGIRNVWQTASDEYKEAYANGQHIHTITDPYIRNHIINANPNVPLRKATFVHRGASLRDVASGSVVSLYGYRSDADKQIYVGKKSEYAPTRTSAIANEQFVGWDGVTNDTGSYRGLGHVIGAYFTKADNDIIRKNFDEDALFNGRDVEKAVSLVRYLRSYGHEFTVRNTNQRNQIEAQLQGTNAPSLRVFDPTSDGRYIGRVYDTMSTYSAYVRSSNQDSYSFTPEDSIAVVDYLMGNRHGVVSKSKTSARATLRIDGLGGTAVSAGDNVVVSVKPVDNRYSSIIYRTPEDAENFLREGITSTKQFIDDEFKLEQLQAVIDRIAEEAPPAPTPIGKDEELTRDQRRARLALNKDLRESRRAFFADIRGEFDAIYSDSAPIREAQERMVELEIHSNQGGLAQGEALRDAVLGTYEDGFNPALVIDHMAESTDGRRQNKREAVLAALKVSEYDMSKLKGNDFAVNAVREQAIRFDPETARGLDDVEHPLERAVLEQITDTLKTNHFRGVQTAQDGFPFGEPEVLIDDKGVVQWRAHRPVGGNAQTARDFELISGEIGQVFVPNEHGIIETQFQNDNNYGIVPGYTGYFAFDGDYSSRMERFRVKGFEQHLLESVEQTVKRQITRPYVKALEDIPTTLDSSAINNLYHGDVYGKRIEPDWMNKSQLPLETREAILKTLSNRVRFDNQFSDHATTSAYTQAQRIAKRPELLDSIKDEASFSHWDVSKSSNGNSMRVLDEDLTNIADLAITGNGKTQGLIWYLVDGAEVNPKDGTVTPSEGRILPDGRRAPDTSALRKLPYFKNERHNAWDRIQMSSNELLTALAINENANTALMSFGGWTFDDSYVVSKDFAERNKIFGKTPNAESQEVLDGLLRHAVTLENAEGQDAPRTPITQEQVDAYLAGTAMRWSVETLREGIDTRHALDELPDALARGELSEEDYRARRQELADSLDEFLDTQGRFRPLQRGDKISDFGGNKGTLGLVVDRNMSESEAKALDLEREVAFFKANPELDVVGAPYAMLSRHNAGVVHDLMTNGEVKDLVNPETGDVLHGAMGQLNVIVSDNAVDKMTHAYTKEDVLEGKGRKASGQLAWALQSKDATHIMDEIYGDNESSWATLREYLIATGLDMAQDGTIQTEYNAHPDEIRKHFMYDPDVSGSEFLDQIKEQGGFLKLPFDIEFKNKRSSNLMPVLSSDLRQNVELIDGSIRRSDFTNQYLKIYESVGEYVGAKDDEAREIARAKVQEEYDKVQDTIIDRQFNGGHNGKHSFIREKIMGRRMENSATGVAIADPRRNIGEVGMDSAMREALGAEAGDVVLGFRDPVWRDGAIRAFTVVEDETAHGCAINPIADKSHDMDFDGDTMGFFKLETPEATQELIEKFSHEANLIDLGNDNQELYFQTGMDLKTGEAVALLNGDTASVDLIKEAHKNALSDDKRLHKKALEQVNQYSHKMFRDYGFGGDYLNLTNDKTVYDSLQQIVDRGAKGKQTHHDDYVEYHEGRKTGKDARDIQFASGVKSDDTGLAGAFSQKLVSIMRNDGIDSALESMYPLTQGTLQIKHDAEHAYTVNEILTEDLNKTFRGIDIKDPKGKRKLTPPQFKAQLTDIMTNRMRVDVSEKHIQKVTDTLTDNNQIIPLRKAMDLKGSPMDRVAYGGGYNALVQLSQENRSLLEGEKSRQFAPLTMRNPQEHGYAKLAKKDTQMTMQEASRQEDLHRARAAELEVSAQQAQPVSSSASPSASSQPAPTPEPVPEPVPTVQSEPEPEQVEFDL